MKTVAIIGGGFSGALIAVNLSRFHEPELRIVVINRGGPLGRGVAYSTRRAEHLLNVAARNMSALADHPNHFVDWLRTRQEYADLPDAVLRESFLPRRVYGDYVRSLLLAYSQPLDRRGPSIEFVNDEAVDVVIDDTGGASVVLASGASLAADKVVLATGNMTPAEILGGDGQPFRHPRYAPSPWNNWETQLPERQETVVLLGTGLTTVDAFLTLSALGWRGTIYAVSRNGLLPQSHFRGIEYPDFPPPDFGPAPLAELVALVEDHCARLRRLGANPAIVVDKLRPHTQRLWQALTLDEKREFCQRYAPRWNVTRHRIAQEIHRQLSDALADGRVQVVKGNIVGLEGLGSRVRVAVRDAAGSNLHLDAGFVVNCTGPLTSLSRTPIPLYRNMFARGIVAPDDLDMGLRVTPDFAVLDQAGNVFPILLAMGPLVRGTLWETVAVPELRGQTLRVARKLVDDLLAGRHPLAPWPAHPEPELLEYCI